MTISDLVKKYHDGRETYLKANYNETQLRTDFLDPFFELLGWDIKNGQGKPTNEREVLVEEALKEDAGSNTKKPDYTFRLFAERKFFLEAKKPNVKIEADPSPAKQVRRYGFTANLKISVLSNFEYLAIYDCSNQVGENDTTANSRVNLYHYTEYEGAFEEIKKQLSQQAVYSGDFDETWKEIEGQLRLNGVDKLFLEQINAWRLILGMEVFSHAPDIGEAELNDIVQRYLNSVIFLRVCEDRNIEVYKTLLGYADKKDFTSLIQKFKEADRKYNAGLFNHQYTEQIITDNSSAFWNIINQLYFPESIYSFAVFGSDILGSIYEVYLGQYLKIEGKKIVLHKKPEHLDRDIVTTPTFIIQDILRETVAKHCKGKTDGQILASSFADIACGSGAFLLEVYQLLHDTLVDYYLETDPDQLIKTGTNSFKLNYETKTQILTSCVFGVDKDYNAVEACKFGLLLKLLEGEANDSIPTPALPNIDGNIVFGNSLLDSTNTPDDKQEEVNVYDFGGRRFDVIIGNPPYMATEHMKQFTPIELPLYKSSYQSAYKQFDKYFLFIERALDLLKPEGVFGYIVPSKFTKVGAGMKLRELLVKEKCVEQIISFGANQVFRDKTTYTCLLILRKDDLDSLQYFEVQSMKDWRTRNIAEQEFDTIQFDGLENDGWLLVTGDLRPVFDSIQEQSIPLEELVGKDGVYNGIQTSANNIFIQRAEAEDADYYYFEKDDREWKVERELTRPYFRTSTGNDNLYTYRPFIPNAFVIYPYLNVDGVLKFVDIDTFKSDYPNAYEYLNHYKKVLSDPKRSIKPEPETEDEWYRYGRHQSLEKCDVPAKIVVGVLSHGDKYAIDYHGTLISSGGTAGYCMITLPQDFEYSIYYIQALLNSKYLEWNSALIGEVFRGGYIARGTKVLKRLPIRVIDFENAEEKKLHDSISATQEELIKIQGALDATAGNARAQTPLKRTFDKRKAELDAFLKDLYGLGEDDDRIPLISILYATN